MVVEGTGLDSWHFRTRGADTLVTLNVQNQKEFFRTLLRSLRLLLSTKSWKLNCITPLLTCRKRILTWSLTLLFVQFSTSTMSHWLTSSPPLTPPLPPMLVHVRSSQPLVRSNPTPPPALLDKAKNSLSFFLDSIGHFSQMQLIGWWKLKILKTLTLPGSKQNNYFH